jgi:adenosine deaminase CECR1
MKDSRNLSGWLTIADYTYDRLERSVQKDFKPLADLNDREMDAWKKAMFLDHDGEGRDEFFEYIWNRLGDVLTSLDVVKELLVENMKRFGAEGVRYLEIQARYKGWLDAEGNESLQRILQRFGSIVWNRTMRRRRECWFVSRLSCYDSPRLRKRM